MTNRLVASSLSIAVAVAVVVVPLCDARRGVYGTCVAGVDCSPPMGWRSWNYFGGNVNQSLMERVVDAMVHRHEEDGVSLWSLGYNDVGLDDNWQACGAGVNGSFHTSEGVPLVNRTTFPDMKAMTDYARRSGVKMGWYSNNCICPENPHNNHKQQQPQQQLPNVFNATPFTHPSIDNVYDNDALATVLTYGYSSTKLDACGQFLDLDAYYHYFEKYTNQTGQPGLLIENCHWGLTVPTLDWCPFSYYRTSGDIAPNWSSMWNNFQTLIPYGSNNNDDKQPPLSRPGCWAYPDMLEVGSMPGGYVEDRSHFGAWCITSSPLILGHDVTNITTTRRIWSIVSNEEAIAVNQIWYDDPGSILSNRSSQSYQIWKKPLNGSALALFYISNNHDGPIVHPSAISMSNGTVFRVRCLWRKKDLGIFQTFSPDPLETHDSHFYILTLLNERKDIEKLLVLEEDMEG